MTFQDGNFYHVFNRGNNRQKIFFSGENYRYFLKKISIELEQQCNLVAYCLMPNHFHFLIHVEKQHTLYLTTEGMQNLERKIGTLQSSYTRAINKQEKRVGSLFQPKSKIVELSDHEMASYCFHYIHQNPVKAGLVTSMGQWMASSYTEYAKNLDGLCNKTVAYNLLKVASTLSEFEAQSLNVINNADVRAALGDVD